MNKNLNGVSEGDFVTYSFNQFPMIEDSYNGSQGTILEIIDEPGEFAIMAKVKWTNGEISCVPVNNLFIQDSLPNRQAA